jgi:hypothetical protein
VLLAALAGRRLANTARARHALARALATGAIPFEVVVGAPWRRLGVRLTLEAGDSPHECASALGLDGHPWGTPDLVGLRIAADGRLDIKPYHRLEALDARFRLPPDLPDALRPVMASEHRGVRELYLRLPIERPWGWFATEMLKPIGQVPSAYAPRPRPAASGFGVSFTWTGADVTAVTLYASSLCLRDDETVREAWVGGMAPEDRRAYELAMAGVLAMGPPGRRGWHSMLWWSVTPSGECWRAASLRLPEAH